ncbi:surface-adhesin E family protein, partial [Thauera sp. 63]|uniref:surface-adhesin E family protein n=1 Tax=Thauera sp. 63 TaxID=497321 RepID=UPI002FC2A1C0
MIASPLQVALAADWQLVLSDRNRRVEIDRGSILTSDRGTKVSWGRVVLANNEVAAAGYATIKALNRYDCQNRTFSTIKRVYLDADDNLVREENVEDQTPLRVTPSSVDERMWREVCGPPSVADLQKVADEVQKLADSMQPRLEAAAPAAPKASAPAPAKAGQPAKPATAQAARAAPIETATSTVQTLR